MHSTVTQRIQAQHRTDTTHTSTAQHTRNMCATQHLNRRTHSTHSSTSVKQHSPFQRRSNFHRVLDARLRREWKTDRGSPRFFQVPYASGCILFWCTRIAKHIKKVLRRGPHRRSGHGARAGDCFSRESQQCCACFSLTVRHLHTHCRAALNLSAREQPDTRSHTAAEGKHMAVKAQVIKMVVFQGVLKDLNKQSAVQSPEGARVRLDCRAHSFHWLFGDNHAGHRTA